MRHVIAAGADCAPSRKRRLKESPPLFVETPKQAGFKWLIAMDRNGNPKILAAFAEDVMAAGNAQQLPTLALKQAREFPAGELSQTAISRTRSVPVFVGSATSTERQPSMAS